VRASRSMCSIKIFATIGEIQDPIGAPKICRYKVLLNAKIERKANQIKQTHSVACNACEWT